MALVEASSEASPEGEEVGLTAAGGEEEGDGDDATGEDEAAGVEEIGGEEEEAGDVEGRGFRFRGAINPFSSFFLYKGMAEGIQVSGMNKKVSY